MNYTINAEDAKLIRKFDEIRQRGYYADGNQVTQIYNRVFNTRLNSTSCGSCLRQRIQQMVDALNHFEAIAKKQEELAQEALKKDEPTPVKEEENKATGDVKNEPTEKKRVGRPKKN